MDSIAVEAGVVNAPVATVVATGIGYSEASITRHLRELDDPSTWTVNIGTNEHKRIVEWLDGDGGMDKNLEPSRSPLRQIGVTSLSIQSPLKYPL